MPDPVATQIAELRVAFARLEQAFKDVDRIVQTFGPTAGQLIRTEANVDQVAEEVDDIKHWITEVEQRMRDELRAAEHRQGQNATRIETACGRLVTQLQQSLQTLKAEMTTAANTKVNARAVVTAAALSSAATILAGKL